MLRLEAPATTYLPNSLEAAICNPMNDLSVDLGQFRENLRLVQREAGPNCKVLFVCKNDAYGLGLIEHAKEATRAGIDHLGVAEPSEALRLREAGIECDILLLAPLIDEQAIDSCLGKGIRLTIGSEHDLTVVAHRARQLKTVAEIHVKVDTGLHRYGIDCCRAEEFADRLACCPEVQLVGVYTHFASADSADKAFALLQLDRFRQSLSAFERYRPQYVHACNSAGFLNLPEARFNLVRVGILAHGIYPDASRRLDGVRRTMSLRSRVAAVRQVGNGEPIGYCGNYHAESRKQVGVVPVGYWHGYPRLVNQGFVLVGGCECPILGSVAMNAMMIDLDRVPEAKVGTPVTIFGDDGDAVLEPLVVARWANSTSYQLLAGSAGRVSRTFAPQLAAPTLAWPERSEETISVS